MNRPDQRTHARSKRSVSRGMAKPSANGQSKPVLQISGAQFVAGLTRLEARWRLKKVPHTHAVAKMLYLREIFDMMTSILDDPLGSGFLETRVEQGLRLADPKLLNKWRSSVRGITGQRICITQAQVDQVARKVHRAWQAGRWLPDQCPSFRKVQRLVLSALVETLDTVLTDPDHDGTVHDLIETDPLPADPKHLAKYLVE